MAARGLDPGRLARALCFALVTVGRLGRAGGVGAPGCTDADLGLTDDVVGTIVNGSANVPNSLGNYFWCADRGFTMCVSDTLDRNGELIAVSHGVCFPSPASRARAFMSCALTDKSTNLSRVPTVQSVLGLQANARAKGLVFEWHCGTSGRPAREFPAGFWVMLAFVLLVAALCLLSQFAEIPKRRPALKADGGESAPLINDRRGSSYHITGAWDGSVGSLKQRIVALAAGDEVEAISSEQWMELTQWVRGISSSRARGEALPLGRRLLKAFCPSDGISSLFATTKNPPALAGLDGLRAFSMLWIILANTSLLVMLVGTDDANAEEHVAESLPQQFTLGASLAVDTFFFLSGLLTTFTLLRNMRKYRQDTFPALWFILMRFVRLTPLYAFLLFAYTWLAPEVSDGPVWYRMRDDAGLCRTTWWSNLLYVNNFYPTTFHSTCMSWTWYLANDMQFFILGLILLKINLKSVRAGVLLCTLISIAGVVAGWMLLLKHRDRTQDDYYDKPYTRVTPFSIGVLLGILLVDFQFINVRVARRSAHVLMAVSLAAIVAVVYVDYLNFAHHPQNDREGSFTDEENAAYQAGGRLVFSVAVACVTWLCVTGHGGPIKAFLSLSVWEPLGKLTYGSYLIHPIVIRIFYYQKVQLFHFDAVEQAMNFISVTVITYAVAAILHVTVELPFANLNKIIFPNPSSKRSARARRQDTG